MTSLGIERAWFPESLKSTETWHLKLYRSLKTELVSATRCWNKDLGEEQECSLGFITRYNCLLTTVAQPRIADCTGPSKDWDHMELLKPKGQLVILVPDERGGGVNAKSVSCASISLWPCLSVFLSLCGQSVSATPTFLSGDSGKMPMFLWLHKASPEALSTGLCWGLILSWLMIVLINGTAYNTETSISSFNWFNFYGPSGKKCLY